MTTEQASHTPGPWTVDGDTIIAENTTRIETIASMNPYTEQGEEVEAANARLIAAGPAMLEALRDIIRDAGYESGLKVQSLHQLQVRVQVLDKACAVLATIDKGE